MPRTSQKAGLIEELTESILVEVLLGNALSCDIDAAIDNSFDGLYLLHSFRNHVPRTLVPKSEEWFSTILTSYDDVRFRRYMRVSRADFGRVLSYIEDHEVFKSRGVQQIPVEKQLAITLFKFGNSGTGSSIGNVAALFGVGDGGTIQNVTDRVIEALLSKMNSWISWPNSEEKKQLETNTENCLPKCIGFIDGSHIDLEEAPLVDPEAYFDRKQNYSIQLQAICDFDKRFRHVFVGFPGSTHDSRVLSNSDIGQSPTKFLSDGQWIAGDSAYPLSIHLLTPFRKNSNFNSARNRQKFNRHFSSYRVKIEVAFGVLKETFASLKQLRIRIDNGEGHRRACRWITACCVLYNMIYDSLDFDAYTISEVEDNNSEGEGVMGNVCNSGELKRTELFEFVMNNF